MIYSYYSLLFLYVQVWEVIQIYVWMVPKRLFQPVENRTYRYKSEGMWHGLDVSILSFLVVYTTAVCCMIHGILIQWFQKEKLESSTSKSRWLGMWRKGDIKVTQGFQGQLVDSGIRSWDQSNQGGSRTVVCTFIKESKEREVAFMLECTFDI